MSLVSIENPKSPPHDEQQSFGGAKREKQTRTPSSHREKSQLLEDVRLEMLDQNVPKKEKRKIMDQLKREYGIGKTSLYKVLNDRLSFMNSDSMSYEEPDGVAIKDPKPTRPEEKNSHLACPSKRECVLGRVTSKSFSCSKMKG